MKEKTSQEKKIPQPSGGGSVKPVGKGVQKYEEEVDFEILDAMEQMEQAKKTGDGKPADADNMFELFGEGEGLNLDDEPTEESGFRFDESIADGLNLDDSLGEETGDDAPTVFENDSFSLDLDQEDDEGDTAFSIGKEDALFEEPAFDLGAESDTLDDDDSLTSETADETGFDLNLESDDFSLDLNTETDFENAKLDLGIESDETSDDMEPLGESEKSADELLAEMEMETQKVMDDESAESDIEDESELPDLDIETESNEFVGKSVIKIGDDQVIDLGDESSFGQDEEEEENGLFNMADDSAEDDEAFADLEQETGESEEESLAGFDTEEEADEGFGSSLDGLDIDLEEEATKVLEEEENLSDISFDDAEEDNLPDMPFDGEEEDALPDVSFDDEADTFDTMQEPERESAAEAFDVSLSVGEEFDDQQFAPLETEEEDLDDESEPTAAEIAAEEPVSAPDDAARGLESAMDDWEFLGLTLSLEETQIREFETKITEAKTIQGYLGSLKDHRAGIKEKIYQKLENEYLLRKTSIFRTDDFMTMQRGIALDLQEMVDQRIEFLSTIETLNDELDEMKIRHLVGEYDDQALAERQHTKQTEMAIWTEKKDKIGDIITRYQGLLDAERELNPLPKAEIRQEIREPERKEPEIPAAPIQVTLAKAPAISEEVTKTETRAIPPRESLLKDVSMPEESFGGMETKGSFFDDETDHVDDSSENFFGDTGFSVETDEEETELEPDDLSALVKGMMDEGDSSVDEEEYDLEPSEEPEQEEPAQEELESESPAIEMITCKKCGRETPASEKFCAHCGAKAR